MMVTSKSINRFLWLPIVALILSSCIKEDNDDCITEIRIDYSYNILNSNAFGEQVDEVTLFIFDEQGVLQRTVHEKGKHVQSNNFTFKLSNLPTGKYQFVSWAQNNALTNEGANFSFPPLIDGKSTLSELKATLQRIENNKTFNSDLNNLLVGYVPTRLTDKATHNQVIIPAKKVNNNIRIILIDQSEKEITTNDFKVRIEEKTGNGIVDYNYNVTSDGPITYTPFYYEKTTPREGEYQDKNPNEKFNAVAAEFGFSRIIENHEINLIIENKEGVEILNKSLLDLIYLLKEEGHIAKEMTFQEYLDREDMFALTLYITGDTSTWLETTIIINGWVINLVDVEL